ncbi:MAG: hypothetical protein AAGA92_02365 [Planctomycetota bacterium]
MNDDHAFPSSYEQWRHCIEGIGKIRLTPSYLSKRLSELQDEKNANTREFSRLYGNDRLQRTIEWFRRAADELT